VREGVRWYLVETRPGQYDFASLLPVLRAATATRTQVIWDLCHYGWPDDLDIFSTAFEQRFSAFAKAFALWLADQADDVPFFVPINEPSYFSWAAGEVAYFFPYARSRGGELKRQLVRANIAAVEAIRSVQPVARFIHVDPLIHVVADPCSPHGDAAAAYLELQHEARDMLTGRLHRELGGREEYLDIVGVSYYPYNQWFYNDQVAALTVTLEAGHPQHRPLRHLLGELFDRYERPLLIAETGTEGSRRPQWLRHVAAEVRAAIRVGVPIEGLCWYPILDHPGWDDDRHCRHGLWGYADAHGHRDTYEPLSRELLRLQGNDPRSGSVESGEGLSAIPFVGMS
jgi:beta-glucosidase/6-phospho-beta-glucosidase/beta-galactosidase